MAEDSAGLHLLGSKRCPVHGPVAVVCAECHIAALAAARREMNQRCADVIAAIERDHGSMAEGAGEPEFTTYTYTEAVLRNAVADIRALEEE